MKESEDYIPWISTGIWFGSSHSLYYDNSLNGFLQVREEIRQSQSQRGTKEGFLEPQADVRLCRHPSGLVTADVQQVRTLLTLLAVNLLNTSVVFH